MSFNNPHISQDITIKVIQEGQILFLNCEPITFQNVHFGLCNLFDLPLDDPHIETSLNVCFKSYLVTGNKSLRFLRYNVPLTNKVLGDCPSNIYFRTPNLT